MKKDDFVEIMEQKISDLRKQASEQKQGFSAIYPYYEKYISFIQKYVNAIKESDYDIDFYEMANEGMDMICNDMLAADLAEIEAKALGNANAESEDIGDVTISLQDSIEQIKLAFSFNLLKIKVMNIFRSITIEERIADLYDIMEDNDIDSDTPIDSFEYDENETDNEESDNKECADKVNRSDEKNDDNSKSDSSVKELNYGYSQQIAEAVEELMGPFEIFDEYLGRKKSKN